MKYKKGDIVQITVGAYEGTVAKVIKEEKFGALVETTAGIRYYVAYSDLAPRELSWDTLFAGDVLQSRRGEYIIVLGILGELVFLSNFSNKEYAGGIYTKKELQDAGYTIKGTTKETLELSLEEVAEKFGVPVEQIKIKKK